MNITSLPNADSSLKPLIFVDLDDTLFRAVRQPEQAEGMMAAAVDRQGSALSFMDRKQLALLGMLVASGAWLVPTTGRNRQALERVSLRFEGPAICSFGGLVLMPNGEPEPTWQRHTERLSREHGPTLAELETAVRRHADEQAVDVRCRQVCDEGLPLYLSVKHNDRDAPSLAAFNEALRPLVPAGWRVHLNANNLAVLPPYLDKSHAVRHVSRQMLGEHAFTLALGDSLSDLPFMAACDYAMTPGDSQIVRELFGAWT